MNKAAKINLILDAFQELLMEKNIEDISVSEIAQRAGIAKGGIYYYFVSKDKIFEALVQRKFETAMEKAKNLAEQADIPAFTRMAMIFTTCKDVTLSFNINGNVSSAQAAMLHKKHMQHVIKTLSPVLSQIISQAIENGEINFDDPDALAEIVLIVLTVKLDNTISPDSPERITKTISGLVSLLNNVTSNSNDLLNFLIS